MPASVPLRTKPSAPSSRERLLEAATSIFARDGLEGATTRAIAQAAEVNEVTLFRHFQTKERLLAAVLERAAAAQTAALTDSTLWTGDLQRDLQHYAEVLDTVLNQNEELIRTLIGEARRHPEHAQQVVFESLRHSRERFIAYLEEARVAGKVRAEVEVTIAADTFTGMLLAGMLRRSKQRLLNYAPAEYVTTCVDIFVRGISAQISPAPRSSRR